MSNVDKSYLAKLLVHGVSQVQAAAALGCTQGYIAQLISGDEELADAIEVAEASQVEKKVATDESLEKIEHRLLGKVDEMVDFADSLTEATMAYTE